MEYTLRRAEPSDKARIEQLFSEMLASVYGRNTGETYEDGYLDGFFDSPDRFIYVAEINDRVEGYISIEIHREDIGFVYLDDFSVSEKYRGNGIGTALIKKAEEYAEKAGIDTAVLHVEKANEGALGFYRKHGYTIESEEDTRYRMINNFFI